MLHKVTFLLVAVLTVFLAWFLDTPANFGLCSDSGYSDLCAAPLRYPYGVILMPLSYALLASALMGSVVTRQSQKKLIWMTVGYAVIAGYILWSLGRSGFGMGGFSLSFDIEIVAQYLAVLYFGISVLLLAVSELYERVLKKGTEADLNVDMIPDGRRLSYRYTQESDTQERKE